MTDQKTKFGLSSEELSALEARMLKRIAEIEARLLKIERFTPAKQIYEHEIKEIEEHEKARGSQ